jgi:hypothetical protein
MVAGREPVVVAGREPVVVAGREPVVVPGLPALALGTLRLVPFPRQVA